MDNPTDEDLAKYIPELKDLLNDCLESCNQENSFTITGIKDGKLQVEFDIFVYEGEPSFAAW